MNLSFLGHALLRDSAKMREFAFGTEAERSKALGLLREHWEKLANLPPAREHRRARSAVDPCDGPLHDDVRLAFDDPHAEIERPPVAADKKRPRGRIPRKATVAKAKRTKARKKAETTTTTPHLPDTERQ